MRRKQIAGLTDKQRMNWYGKIMGALHLDEIPQLINILIGDMSFIGPRPLLPKYFPYFTDFEIQRHKVRPGLTCLSQVKCIYPSWEGQFAFDIEYVEKLSFKLDVVIFFMTFAKVLSPPKALIAGDLHRSG